MTEEEIIVKAQSELKEPTDEWSKILMDTHSYVAVNNKIKIDRVEIINKEKIAIVYAPVYLENFYFAVFLDLNTNKVFKLITMPNCIINFFAVSNTHSGDEMKKLTKISNVIITNKGEKSKEKHPPTNKQNSLTINGDTKPDYYKTKLKKLLTVLESDKEGIRRISKIANVRISIMIEYHLGTGFLGEIELNKKLTKRLKNLNILVRFNLLARGNSMKTPS